MNNRMPKDILYTKEWRDLINKYIPSLQISRSILPDFYPNYEEPKFYRIAHFHKVPCYHLSRRHTVNCMYLEDDNTVSFRKHKYGKCPYKMKEEIL